jgi:hypothetical protein
MFYHYYYAANISVADPDPVGSRHFWSDPDWNEWGRIRIWFRIPGY